MSVMNRSAQPIAAYLDYHREQSLRARSQPKPVNLEPWLYDLMNVALPYPRVIVYLRKQLLIDVRLMNMVKGPGQARRTKKKRNSTARSERDRTRGQRRIFFDSACTD